MKELVYLAGGGNEYQSARFDNKFFSDLQTRSISKLIFIPLAQETDHYQQAEEWFKGVYSGKGLEIETWTELNDKKVDPKKTSLYLGGGNTMQLLARIKESGFDKRLGEFLKDGGILYGGSAGAIVMGADIRTAPEARRIQLDSYQGLDLLNGYSVACHFTKTMEESETYSKLREEIGSPIIALTELGGVIIQEGQVKIFDDNEVKIF